MRRKLSAIEHMIDGNIVYFVRVEGTLDPERLRQALGRVQRKHPALRTLIREERDGLYYEEDCAPEVPLRVLRRVEEDDFRRESQLELTTVFAFDQPQLRAVVLQSERETDLLLVTSHRVCDGMSMLTIVREVLRALHKDEDMVPYAPITTRDMIGDYHPPQPWKRKLTARLVNGFTRLIPHSRRASVNKEHCLEWAADRALSDTLKQRCKAEGVSIHAALVVALDRALFTVLGKKKAPALIESPMDARRGRLAALKSDMLFFGGGSLGIPTGRARELDFWARAREIHEQIRRDIERELLNIPGRYHFFEMLRPLPSAQMQSMVRLGDALKVNGSWNRVALSNLGNVVVGDSDAPFRVKDLRLYVHSFNIRLLGLVAYTLNGEMRFYFVSDEKCLSLQQAEGLKREIMALLGGQLMPAEDRASEALLVFEASAG
jgi:condensation domain-containing protein